jgi:hypothetical protein
MSNKLLNYNNNNISHYSPNIFVQKKDTFEETNNTINSLNEEIIKLKRQNMTVYEKEQQIIKLKKEINKIQKDNSDSEINKLLINRLKSENKEQAENIINLNNNISQLNNKNKKLEEKTNSIELKNNILIKKCSQKEIKIKELNKYKLKENKIDIEKITNVINKKLLIKNDNKILELLKKHTK